MIASEASELTTTSYGILGLLAIKPWTTYELAQQMDRAIGQFWPRARSKVYEEPKKLVAHGMAKASSENVGNRPRTVYTITPKGRRALAAWAPKPSDPPVLEWELLMRVFFAEHGSKEDLLATLADIETWMEERCALGARISGGYVEGKGPFPERLPWLILTGKFLDDFNLMVERWAKWATSVVQTWPDDIRDATPEMATLEEIARVNQERADRMAKARNERAPK